MKCPLPTPTMYRQFFLTRLKTEPSLSAAITQYDIYSLQSHIPDEFCGGFKSPKGSYTLLVQVNWHRGVHFPKMWP